MKKKIILHSLLILISYTHAFGKYEVSKIDKKLKKYSSSIIREYKINFELEDKKNYTKTITKAITVFDEEGASDASFHLFYEKEHDVSDIDCIIYNEDGSERREVESKDFIDLPAISSLYSYSDTKFIKYEIHENKYPFTIEYSYEIESSNGFIGEVWLPVNSFRQSVEKANIEFKTPKEITLKFKELNLKSPCKITKQEDENIYSWSLSNYKAKKNEGYNLAYWEVLPYVNITPTEFYYDGEEGSLKNWNVFGSFLNKISSGRDQISPALETKIKELTKECKTNFDKIEAVYKFMQNNTRYVSIQYGIGGFQTLPASFVEKNGFGDCKALSNYMKAMLKVIGIESRMYIIGSNMKLSIYFEDFPSFGQANHQMLMVPLKEDTVWLECTSTHLPCGYIGESTSNKKILVFDQNGGHVLRTPKQKNSRRIRKINASILENESMELETTNSYFGSLYPTCLYKSIKSKKDQEENLLKTIPLESIDLKEFEYKTTDSRTPVAIEKYKLTTSGYLKKNNAGISINPNILSKLTSSPKKVRRRKSKFELDSEYSLIDSVTIDIPKKLSLVHIPKDVEIKTKFGLYRTKFDFKDHKIIYYRERQVYKGVYEAKEYKNFFEFLNKVRINDNKQIFFSQN